MADFILPVKPVVLPAIGTPVAGVTCQPIYQVGADGIVRYRDQDGTVLAFPGKDIPITSGAAAPPATAGSPTVYTNTTTGDVYYRDTTGSITLLREPCKEKNYVRSGHSALAVTASITGAYAAGKHPYSPVQSVTIANPSPCKAMHVVVSTVSRVNTVNDGTPQSTSITAQAEVSIDGGAWVVSAGGAGPNDANITSGASIAIDSTRIGLAGVSVTIPAGGSSTISVRSNTFASAAGSANLLQGFGQFFWHGVSTD